MNMVGKKNQLVYRLYYFVPRNVLKSNNMVLDAILNIIISIAYHPTKFNCVQKTMWSWRHDVLRVPKPRSI